MGTNVDMCDTMHRWSSYGLRPSLGIRRYLSANLPSRLRSGPPHSTQCVGAASTLDHIFRFAVRAPEWLSHRLELPERNRENQDRHCTKHDHPAGIHKLAFHGPHAKPLLWKPVSKKGPPATDQRLRELGDRAACRSPDHIAISLADREKVHRPCWREAVVGVVDCARRLFLTRLSEAAPSWPEVPAL